MSDYHYKAFISYSHADSRVAAWLQRTLESYRVPSRLVGKMTANGRLERRLGTIFRDRDDLSAGVDLTQSISEALAASEYQIVICSPASRNSHWVNLEISEFAKTHDQGSVLCLIVDGEPLAQNISLDCFPPALAYRDDSAGGAGQASEPIAADIRTDKDGKRLAKLKIIAGLLDLGLDELVQRDAHRRNRNLLLLSLASLAGMLLMATLSFIAIDARNKEQLRRAEAEDLIEFMLTDLRDRLDAVGRLDVLDAVGEKAIEYYSRLELSRHTESSLGRRSRAFHLLGEVDDALGDLHSARFAFQQAYETTVELLARSPNDGDRIFDHAQSIFWVGYLDWRTGKFPEAESAFLEYREMARQLTALDADNVSWLIELANANLNLGVYAADTRGPKEAIGYFEEAHTAYRNALDVDPGNSELLWSYGQSYAWLADAHEDSGSLHKAGEMRLAETSLYRGILDSGPVNQQINLALLTSLYARGDILFMLGQVREAVDDYGQARQYGDQLLEYEPDNTNNIESVAALYADLAIARSYLEGPEMLMQLMDVAGSLVAQLLQDDSSVFTWKLLDFNTRVNHSMLLVQIGDERSGREALRSVLSDIQSLRGSDADIRDLQFMLARCYFGLSELSRLDGDEAGVLELARLTVALLSIQVENLPPIETAMLAIAYRQIGNADGYSKLQSKLTAMNFNHPRYTPYLGAN